MEWTYEALWAKSKLYMERALNSDRGSSDFPFFAVLALEFLSRSVLAKMHPSLLADPQDANSILYANDIPATDKPRSIPAKTVFLRLRHVVPDYSKDDEANCLKFAELRNRELHSGGAPFADLSIGSWIPEFYRVVEKLVLHLGLELSEFLGDEEAPVAKRIIEESLEEDRNEVETLKAEIKKKFDYLTDAEREERIAKHAPPFQTGRVHGDIVKAHQCPCCGNQGVLAGDVTGKRPPSVGEESIISRLVVTPKLFICRICEFRIDGYGKLRVVSLAEQFEYSEHLDPVEYFGIEPMEYISEEEMRDYFGDHGYFNE